MLKGTVDDLNISPGHRSPNQPGKGFYSGFRWRKVHGEACNACPARLLVYPVRSGTAIYWRG
jgi:hypothetical protein